MKTFVSCYRKRSKVDLNSTITMESKLVHSRRKWLFFIFFTALLLLSLIVAQLPSWREVVIELPDGSFTLSRERQEAIDEKISRYRTQTEL